VHRAGPSAEADRGRHLGFPSFNDLGGSPGSLATDYRLPLLLTIPFTGAEIADFLNPPKSPRKRPRKQPRKAV